MPLIKSESEMIQEMKGLWCSAIEALGLTSPDTTQYFNNTMELYKEAHRKYHNVAHVYALCQEWLKHEDRFENPLVVLFAIFFHDRIYSVGKSYPTNESRSAKSANEFFKKAVKGFPSAKKIEIMFLALRVFELVTMTKAHKCSADDQDAKIFLDMDMLILSAEPEEYDLYCKQIKEEFSSVPQSIYNKLRIAQFLSPTLASDRIYLSDVYADREDKARANLGRELQQLTT